MRPSRVLAIVALLTMGFADAALAQQGRRQGAAPAAAAQPDPAALKAQGMQMAPGLIQARGLPCTLADADVRAITKDTVEGKELSTHIIEIACQSDIGYLVAQREDGEGGAVDCLEARASSDEGVLHCTLPGNANAAPLLQPLVTRAGSRCEVDKAQFIGRTGNGIIYEAACKNGSGAVVMANLPRTGSSQVTIASCLALEGSARKCTLTTAEANLAVAKALAEKLDKPCAVKTHRYVMPAAAGDYYEYACEDGAGYMIQANPATLEFVRALPCASAAGIGGGCTLTTRVGSTEDAALYTKLAKDAGFDCAVREYFIFPQSGSGREIVELGCSNRPDGAVAVFVNTGKAEVLNCGRSVADGYGCSLTPKDVAAKAVTQQLAALGKSTCQVNDFRAMGRTTAETRLEVSCADGEPGWVVKYPLGVNAPTEVLTCSQSGAFGGGCQLATNRRAAAPAR